MSHEECEAMECKTECVILLPPNGKTLAVRRWWIQPEHKLTPQNDEIGVERNEVLGNTARTAGWSLA